MPTALWLAACAVGPVDLPPGPPSVDPADPAEVGWAQVAVDEQGVAWVSWAEVAGGVVQRLLVARSGARGEPLAAPSVVPLPEPPVVGTTEKPALAAFGGRVALGYAGRGSLSAGLRHGDATVAYVQLASVDGDALRWDPAVPIDDTSADGEVCEQLRVAFEPSGELWAFWKRQVYGVSDFPTWGRETEGFAGADVSADLTHRHDCSPPDFRFSRAGQALLALRSNEGGWLQTVVVAAATRTVTASDDWKYNANVCPTDGPRVVDLADGTLFAAWITPNAEQTWHVEHASSADGGETWSDPVVDHGDVGLGERWVATASDDALLYLTAEGIDRSTRLFTRPTPDATGEERPLLTPDGLDLTGVELAAGGGRAVAVGVDATGAVRFLDL